MAFCSSISGGWPKSTRRTDPSFSETENLSGIAVRWFRPVGCVGHLANDVRKWNCQNMRRIYLPEPPPVDAEEYKGYHFARLVGERNKLPSVKAWKPKGQKPYAYYAFIGAQQAEDWIVREKRYIDSNERALAERKARRQTQLEEMRAKLVIGTIVYVSWGYDQTNIDFYEVVARKGDMVTIRELAAITTETGFMCGLSRPRPGVYIGEPMRKRIVPGGIHIGDARGWAHITSADAEHHCSWYA